MDDAARGPRDASGGGRVVVLRADHQRTRLTHALEVAQGANGIARACRLNVALTEAIALGRTRRVWPGLVRGRRFLMSAGAGLDSQVVHSVSPGLKRRAGKLAYVWETAAAGWKYRFPVLQVRVDDVPREAYSVVVSKTSRYAGPYVLAREARLDEPRFQVCLFKGRGLWNVFRYSLGLMASRMRFLPDVEILPAERVRISGPEVPLQIDGDPGGFLPVDIGIDREPLNLIVG